MGITRTSNQSPAGYSASNLAGAQLAARMAATFSDAQSANLRLAFRDVGYAFSLHPQEAALGYTSANIKFGYNPGNPFRYGCVGDGATDDTANMQRWLNFGMAVPSLELELPAPVATGFKITTALAVTAPVQIRGHGYNRSCLYAVGCDGFTYAAGGVSQVRMQDFRINQSVRYTTSVNTVTGIHSLGTAAQSNHTYRNVFIDGFQTAINASGMQGSDFDNCMCFFGQNGLIAQNTPVNLRVRGGIYQCGTGARIAGSIGIQFGDGATAAQGCSVTDAVVLGFDTNVWLFGANYCKVQFSYLDFTNGVAVLMQSGTNSATSNDISFNYIAMTAAGSTGIRCLSSVASSTPKGNRIAFNTILQYAAGPGRGILVDGTNEDGNAIVGNTINCGSVADCDIQTGGTHAHIVDDNSFQGLGFNSTVRVNYTGSNVGSLISNVNVSVIPPSLLVIENAPAFGANVAIDLNTGNRFVVTAASNAAFNFTNPVNPPANGGGRFTIVIKNTAGVAIAVPTFGAAYKTPALTMPATGFNRTYEFEYGTGALFYLKAFTGADVPN